MPSPTQIIVSIDKEEYSRLELENNTILATVTLVGGSPWANEQVRVDLVKARRSRDAVVGTVTLTFNSSGSQTAEFHLPDLVDNDAISLIRHGQYFVRATSLSNQSVVGSSKDFPISVITVDAFRKNYLFGLSLQTTDFRAVKFQPSEITGVTVTELSKGHPMGLYTLTYNYHTNGSTIVRTLSWNGGTSVSITKPGNYILPMGSGVSSGGNCSDINPYLSQYAVVKVSDLALLPTESKIDNLLVENPSFSDDKIRYYIQTAVSWVEEVFLRVYLDPTKVATERDSTAYQFGPNSGPTPPMLVDTDYDFIKSPLTYRPYQGDHWISIQFPYPQMLRINDLYGVIGSNRVLSTNLEWIQISQQGGFTQLIPYNQEAAFSYFGLMYVQVLRGNTSLPNFWHYNAVVGLRQATPDLIELVAKKAMLEALMAAGLANRPGVASTSLSRDGVSQSVSYTSSSKYGLYTGQIQQLEDWFEKNGPIYKAKYRGTPVMALG